MTFTTTAPMPQSASIGIATLTSATPITSRANITGTTGLVVLTANPTNNKRTDRIRIKCKGTSVASIVFLWMYNGTTSYLWDEIPIKAVTADSTVTPSFSSENAYVDVTLPPNMQLYVSQTVATDCTVFACAADY